MPGEWGTAALGFESIAGERRHGSRAPKEALRWEGGLWVEQLLAIAKVLDHVVEKVLDNDEALLRPTRELHGHENAVWAGGAIGILVKGRLLCFELDFAEVFNERLRFAVRMSSHELLCARVPVAQLGKILLIFQGGGKMPHGLVVLGEMIICGDEVLGKTKGVEFIAAATGVIKRASPVFLGKFLPFALFPPPRRHPDQYHN